MKIGIIGSGNIGSALTRRFRATGHEVTVANSRGPASLTELARETGARAVSVRDAARGNDVVVVAIPMSHVKDLPSNLFADASANTIVVDTSNYYPRERDGRIDEIEGGLTESGWVEKRLGHPVVKAMNMIIAAHILGDGKAAGAPDRTAVAVAGDDPAAKTTVMHLIDDIGFDSVDAGSIAESWRQEPGSPVYGKDYNLAGVRRALNEAHHDRPAAFRATPQSPGTYEKPA